MFFSGAWWAVVGTTPGAAVIFAFFLLICLLTISGASLPCVCVLVRYQVEGVESNKENKKKILRHPTNPMQRGLVHGKGCMSRTVLQKILYG